MITKLIYYRHNNKGECAAFARTNTPFHDLTLVLDGEMEYTVDGKTCTLTADDAVYMPPESVSKRKRTETADYVSFNFTTDEPLPFPNFLKKCVGRIAQSIIHVFDSIYAQTINLSDPRFLPLFECLLLQIKMEYSIREEKPISNKIKQFVKNNLDKKITLEDISNVVFLSPNYCDRIFKQETGCSIVDYIIDKRIQYAQNLLWDLSLKLTTIAAKVGYPDYGYFCRIFKKRVGYTPLQYRKQLHSSIF